MVGGVQNGCIVEDLFFLEMRDNAADILIDSNETGVVVLRDAFKVSAGHMCGGCAQLVLSIDKTLGLSGIALEIIVETGRLRNGYSVIEVRMPACPEEWLMRCNKPDQKAEWLIPTIFIDP